MNEDVIGSLTTRGRMLNAGSWGIWIMTQPCRQAPVLVRRSLLLGGAALIVVAASRTSPAIAAAPLPREVAGIRIPDSAIATKAADLSRQSCPDFLFNHCMRTFVFGAIAAQQQNLAYREDEAFVAAALHDLGLLPAFESKTQSFEIDGADRAEKFAIDAGLSRADADIVWHAVEMHDGKWALTRRQGPEAMLVSMGAGADVDGPDHDLDPHRLAEVLAAFPRLGFKKQFTALLVDHCKRKPLSQRGTWLEGLCREQKPDVWTSTVEDEIAKSGYAE